MPDYYPPEATTQSRKVLQEVCALVPDSVLIGGWGTWVRLRGAMSHDIDLIVSRADLAILSRGVGDLSESTHLAGRKWRASYQDVHLDLYVPYQSRLGQRLALRVEHLVGYAEHVDGWHVLAEPAHVATKFAALLDRPDSLPGEKDRHEIVELLRSGVAPHATAQVIREASQLPPEQLRTLVATAFDYLQEYEVDGQPLGRKDRLWLRTTANQWSRALA